MADRRRHPGWATAIMAGRASRLRGQLDDHRDARRLRFRPHPRRTRPPRQRRHVPAASARPPLAAGPSEPPRDSLRNARRPSSATVCASQWHSDSTRSSWGSKTSSRRPSRTPAVTPLYWAGGCAGDVWAAAELTGTPWRREHRSRSTRSSVDTADWLQASAYVDAADHVAIRSRPVDSGQTEDWCPDWARRQPQARASPGRSELLWDGHAAFRLGPPPSSPAVITATFDYWYRE